MTATSKEDSPLSSTPKKASEKQARRKPKTIVETLQLGVYRVSIQRTVFSLFDFDPKTYFEDWVSGFKILERLVRDIFALAPNLIILMALVNVWDSIERVALLGLETRLLRIIEIGLTERNVDAHAIIYAVLSRVIFVITSSLIQYWSRTLKPRVQNRVVHHYDDYLLISRLKMDLPSVQENLSDEHLSARVPWYTFMSLMDLVAHSFAVVSQLGFIFHIARSGNHGITFAILCIAKPVINTFVQHTLWAFPRVVEANNSDFLRMRSLTGLTDKSYRMDILSGNLVQYIITEFRKSRKALGDTSIDYPEYQYSNMQSPTVDVVANIIGDFPVMYYAAIALLSPSNISVSTIASLQQSATLLRWSFWDIYSEADSVRQNVSRVQQLYDLEKGTNIVKDGDLPYPPEKHSEKGMALELRNVSFSYPGSEQDAKALEDVSFRIEPGELVVIVGANGSGKSTFVKLLTRLYDAKEGTVLVDGEDIKKFKIAELRRCMAALTQDHQLYPLSIEENIGLGYPEAVHDIDLITEAAKKGGADEILSKLSMGMKTVLDPCSIQYGVNVEEKDETELAMVLKELRKSTEVSGGERQRLVAARTFMRFNSNQVKFVAVDEPSSALDPEGELNLFNNLREARKGKTMLFVTHRFGHLTKHADKILCMKDGKVAEFGTHSELIAWNGEYCKMYNIQAKAFDSDK